MTSLCEWLKVGTISAPSRRSCHRHRPGGRRRPTQLHAYYLGTVYAAPRALTRTASKDVFPLKPENVPKPFMTGGSLPKIVSLEEALKRATPRSKKKGGKLTADAKAKEKAARAAKRKAAAPPAKKPSARAAKKPAYSPSFP